MLLSVVSTRAQVHFDSCVSSTGNNASVIVDITGGSFALPDGAFAVGDEIAFYSEDGACVGVRAWTGSNFSLTLWGDNPATSAKDGLYAGEKIEMRVWQSATQTEYGGANGTIAFAYNESPPFIAGGTYYPDGLYNLVEVVVSAESPTGKNLVKTSRGKGNAKERGKDKTGALKITRDGSLEESLTVFFTIEGTAENGIDYTALDTFAVIEAGNMSTYVIVDPLPDSGIEGTETVSIALLPNELYDIEEGLGSASLTIADGGGSVGTDDLSARQPASLWAFPNPFGDHLSVEFVAGESEVVTLSVFDALGRAMLINEERHVRAGDPVGFDLDTTALPSGLYFVRVSGRSTVATRAIVRTH